MSFIRAGLLFALILASGSKTFANTADILVFYTPDAERTAQGRDMPARIASYIAYANQSLRNSEVDLQFNLVGYERLDVGYDYPTFNNVRSFAQNREIARKRLEYGADMVTLLNLRQPTNGGFICGIAADVTRGDSRTGQFSPYAASVAYNLTGIDCGLNTFIHEFGHNMGLGHGVRQNAPGGVFSWARGYGVDRAFSTIMGYPQAYGTRNQLPIFSNASRFVCEGLACGRDASERDGADASRALNIVANQISNFVERRPGGSNPNTPATELISNGAFTESAEGWSSKYGQAEIASIGITARGEPARLARVTAREDFRSGLYQDLGNSLKPGVTYQLSGSFAITGNEAGDEFKFALEVREGNNVRFQYLERLDVANSTLTDYSTTFNLDASNATGVGLIIYGPEAGVTVYADDVSLKSI